MMKLRVFSERGRAVLARLQGWFVPLLLLGAAAYAIAEEITLTTYYPSPRGVYSELRTLGNLQVGSITPPGEVGGPPAPAPQLYVAQNPDPGNMADMVQVVDRAGGNVFAIEEQGRVTVDTSLLLPRLTTAQRDALGAVPGLTVFNVDRGQTEVFNGQYWGAMRGFTSKAVSYVYPPIIWCAPPAQPPQPSDLCPSGWQVAQATYSDYEAHAVGPSSICGTEPVEGTRYEGSATWFYSCYLP